MLNESFEPILIISPYFNCWVYSLCTPTQVTVQCQDVGPPIFQLSYQAMFDGGKNSTEFPIQLCT